MNFAIHNPHNKPEEELPTIFGFSNGGSPGLMRGALLAEDGEYMGGHLCSEEGWMPFDLGCAEGTRSDRHENDFQKKYPEGYRMEFVCTGMIRGHDKLMAAIEAANKKAIEEQKAEDRLAASEPAPEVRSDDPYYEDFDADIEHEPLEDIDGWHE